MISSSFLFCEQTEEFLVKRKQVAILPNNFSSSLRLQMIAERSPALSEAADLDAARRRFSLQVDFMKLQRTV